MINMNYDLVMLPQPILVSDEEIKENDSVYTPNGVVVAGSKEGQIGWLDKKGGKYLYFGTEGRKIIAGIDDKPKLDLSVLAKEVGWVDVEKLSYKHFPKNERGSYGTCYSYDNEKRREGFIEAFRVARSIDSRKFTVADMEAMCTFGMALERFKTDPGRQDNTSEFKGYLEELSKPKEYEVGVEMEDVGGYRQDSMNGCWISKWQPKITNNTIKVNKIIKQL